MKKIIPLLLFLTGVTQAAPFADGDAKIGKKLFDQYKCHTCHIARMGGDGSEIFTRSNHKVTSPELMIKQIKMCSGNVGANLTAPEEQHLAAWLNQQYYKFK